MIRSAQQTIKHVSDTNDYCCPHCYGKDVATSEEVKRNPEDVVNDPPDTYDKWQCYDCGQQWLVGFQLVFCPVIIKTKHEN